MRRKSAGLVCFVCVLGLATGVCLAGVAFPEPAGGWKYIYTADANAPGDPDGTQGYKALDGTWSHQNGSDSWDLSGIGRGKPGGVSGLSEGTTRFLRLLDPGDPRDHGQSDPSNRKIYFGHSITNDLGAAVADTILDKGVTISFRARLSTTPPLDGLYPDTASNGENRTLAGGTAWPADGSGCVIHDGGKGNFGVRQAGGDKIISFCLALASDDIGTTNEMAGKQGLVINKLNGASPSGDVDMQGDEPGTVNILEVADLKSWHEFWIIIQADTGRTLQPGEAHRPLQSPAEIYSAEPINSKKVNFKDYAILMDQWLEEHLWPTP